MIGSHAEVTLTVGEADTAIAHGSGDVPVLATPRVLALAEEAAVLAIKDAVDVGQTSVGIHADLHHVKATPVGGVVTATASVMDVDGRRITFGLSVLEGDDRVAYGTHQRVIVNRDRFPD